MKTKLFAVVMFTMMLGSLVWAGGQAEDQAEDDQLTFAFSIMILDNPYFIAVRNGFEDRAEELGIETIVNDAQYDSARQFSQLENYISTGVDAIALAPIDQRSVVDVVQRAKDAGIVVVSEAQPIENADANIIVNDYDYGYTMGSNAARWINEELGGTGKVALIVQDNVESVILRGNGIEDAINEQAPGAEIIARQTGDTPDQAFAIAETLLQAHPDLEVIQCVNDSSALGAHEAVQLMGRASDRFYVGGADATAEGLAKMAEEGSVFRSTVDIDPYGTGRLVVDKMYEYVTEGVQNETIYFDMIPIWQDEL
jgi:ABC-type sugar transport system substrate-binding protein